MELKQLEYFIACAEMGSFRKAAGVLYTSQSNVSKVIQSLENELDGALLHRSQTGVTLTDQGAAIYEHAKSTLESARRITRLSDERGTRHLNILTNPSSWVARTFRRYYQAHDSKGIRYSVLTASTNDIIRTMAADAADIGFVYVMEQQLSSLQTQLTKNHLTFAPLARTGALLYAGAQLPQGARDEGPIPLIQGYEDEFTLKSYWNTYCSSDDTSPTFEVSVVTNSDYLMTEMLENTSLSNISCDQLDQGRSNRLVAQPLFQNESPVLFGFICRSDQKLKQEALEFLRFVKKQLV